MRPCRSLQSRQAGVALIVVLWAVALISAAMLGLAAILQRQLGQEVAALQNSRATLVAESGLQMALNQQIQPAMAAETSRMLSVELQKGWAVPVEFEVGTQDLRGEDGKINLNAFDVGSPGGREFARRVLTNLLGSWDVNPTTSSAFIDGLFDFIDPDRNPSGANEATEEGAKNAPLENLAELEEIPGWAQVLEESKSGNWRQKFTIYGSGKLSLKYADADVIEAWLGCDSASVENFIRARLGADLIEGTQDDQVNLALLGPLSPDLLATVTSGGEDLWRVTSTGSVGGVKRRLVALISRTPPLIKARWIEDRAK